jgi:hypothetical protein
MTISDIYDAPSALAAEMEAQDADDAGAAPAPQAERPISDAEHEAMDALNQCETDR